MAKPETLTRISRISFILILLALVTYFLARSLQASVVVEIARAAAERTPSDARPDYSKKLTVAGILEVTSLLFAFTALASALYGLRQSDEMQNLQRSFMATFIASICLILLQFIVV